MKVEIEIPEGHELKKEGDTYRVVKVEKKLPESFDDLDELQGFYVDSTSGVNKLYHGYIDRINKNTFATKQQAKAAVALAQLTQLLKAYNGDWKPDWMKGNVKYCIELYENRWNEDSCKFTHHLFAFETAEKRDHFLEHHIDLLNQVKPLYGG